MINRDVLRLVASVAQGKNYECPWDSTVNEVYYEVHMTRVMHTARISNVDSVMFVNRIREMVIFVPSSWQDEKYPSLFL